ncbi:MAG: hypothetical protein OJJ21_19230 [Ferrovibrio sp.]|uniref:hypothetical protein n=1 Tax=Ferrovibrio sp. TaxID=1917215 RepID=UPI00261CA319|nr:hypothetical protein [Ferrovibrio sp.]MCW0235742.1 hypothetical protein [Ferrovibrio sp.]
MSNSTNNESKPHAKRRGGVITEATLTGLRAALNGMTPREKGAEKAAQALDWMYRWGWTTSSVIATLAGTGRNSALAARLAKNGWAKRQPIRIVSSFHLTPTDILSITPEGVAELVALRGELPFSRQGSVSKRVVKKNVTHDLLVQKLTLMYMGRWPGSENEDLPEGYGPVTEFTTAHQLGEATLGEKIPDAIWCTESGHMLAIELELSPKYGRELDQFIKGHLDLQRRATDPVDGLVTFFASPDTAERYARAMSVGRRVQEWAYDKMRREWWPLPNAPKIELDANFITYEIVLPRAAR